MKHILLIALLLVPLLAYSQRKEMPLDSLNYIQFMKKADFDKRFPGKLLQGESLPEQEGFYIVYEHESLAYYFGPAEHRSVAEIYKAELDKVVAEVQGMREQLKSAKTYILKLPEEQTTDSSQPQTEKQETLPAPTPQPEPEQDEPWWTKLFRALGF